MRSGGRPHARGHRATTTAPYGSPAATSTTCASSPSCSPESSPASPRSCSAASRASRPRSASGLEFRAITAVVLGGVVLGGGRGSVVAAMAGALTLEALFTLLNLLGVSAALESPCRASSSSPRWPTPPAAPTSPTSCAGGSAENPRPTSTHPPNPPARRTARQAPLTHNRRIHHEEEAHRAPGGGRARPHGVRQHDASDDSGGGGDKAAEKSKFFVQADYDRQLALRDIEAEGPGRAAVGAGPRPGDGRHGQVQEGRPSTTSASPTPPWTTRGARSAGRPCRRRSKLHPEIGSFKALDAEGKDDKQICDIESLTSGKCDALIVSPNTTATLTPAVEQACETGIPVIVFDRGVDTDCPVTFINPIGGYAFGADGAEFLEEKVKPGRQDPRAADPARRRRAGEALGRGEGDLRRAEARRRRRRVHRR